MSPLISTLPVGLALIGCGQIARLHAQRIQEDGRGRLVALFDPNRDSALRIQAEFAPEARVYTRFEDLLADSQIGIQAVIVCTPTQRHFEDVQMSRRRGWPVLCEKPLADNLERIEQLISECDAGGPLLSVAYQRRHQALYRTLRREIQCGRWGRVVSVASHNCEHWEQFQALPGTWRDDPAQNPGGYLGDAGSHKLDILFHITGLLPTEVFAVSSKSQRHVEIVTMVAAKLTGQVPLGMTFLGNAHHFAEYLHIVCEGADFKLVDNQLHRGVLGAYERVLDLEPESNPVSVFLNQLLDGSENAAPAKCARPVYLFTAGVLQSAATGNVVQLGRER